MSDSRIHPTALIDKNARLGNNVTVGPYAIIESGVEVGANSIIMARAHLMTGVKLGQDNEIHPGVVLGNTPQDKAFDRHTVSFVEIGNNNIFRENATVHRATTPGSSTTIGHGGFFMGNSHIAHDAIIGDDVIVCNNTVLAGYVQVGNQAFISGNVVVHQFTRIGDLCMLGGGCGAGQDAPPFSTVIGRSQIRGLNVVGMRRAGFDGPKRLAIKKLYARIFACRGKFEDVLGVVKEIPDGDELTLIRNFYQAESRRGFMWPPISEVDKLDDRARSQGKR